jgi:hypothetical protein
MAFDAFEQFIEPSSNAPSVEGEDQAPPMASPSPALELQEEKPTEATEKVSDSTATRKP